MSILFIFIAYGGTCQVQNRFTGWFSSANSIPLKKKFGLQVDFSLRTSDQWKYLQTIFLRTGFSYQLTNSISALLGYGYTRSQTNIADQTAHITEHQIWQRIIIRHFLFKKINTTHRLWFEERFIENVVWENNSIKSDGYSNAYRFRYLFRNTLPLNNQNPFNRGLYAFAQQEILLNMGDKAAVNGKTYDQFRANEGFGYRFSPIWEMEMGYLFRDIATKSSAHFHDHIIQVSSIIRL